MSLDQDSKRTLKHVHIHTAIHRPVGFECINISQEEAGIRSITNLRDYPKLQSHRHYTGVLSHSQVFLLPLLGFHP